MNFLNVVVPIFGLIAVGWLLKAVGLFPEWLVKLINDYVYYIGIAVITFLSLHDTSLDMLLNPRIYLLSLMPMVVTIFIAFAAAHYLKLEKAVIPIFITCAFFGNTAYIGFPLNVAVQGKDSLGLAAFISTIYTVVVFTVGAYICQKYSESNGKGVKLHKIPVFWAAALGLGLSWIALPGLVRLPLEIITDTTSPLALLATGAMFSAPAIKANLKAIGALSIIKLIMMPAVVVVIAVLAGVNGTVFKTSLLAAATPVGVTNTALAIEFSLDKKFASGAVIITTVLFLVTLSVILIVL